jgi:hypothetical protein
MKSARVLAAVTAIAAFASTFPVDRLWGLSFSVW